MSENVKSHTPGPWRISGVPGDNYVMAADGRNRVSVCQLMGWPGITPEELEANKRLIRAAPDLLSALKYLLDARSKTASVVISAIECAQDAINQADGRPL